MLQVVTSTVNIIFHSSQPSSPFAQIFGNAFLKQCATGSTQEPDEMSSSETLTVLCVQHQIFSYLLHLPCRCSLGICVNYCPSLELFDHWDIEDLPWYPLCLANKRIFNAMYFETCRMEDAYFAMQECERFVNPYCTLVPNAPPRPDDIMAIHKSDQRCLVVEIIRRHLVEDESALIGRTGAFDWCKHVIYQEDFGPSFNPAWIVSNVFEQCALNMGLGDLIRNWTPHRRLDPEVTHGSGRDWPATHGTRDAASDQLLRRTIFFDALERDRIWLL